MVVQKTESTEKAAADDQPVVETDKQFITITEKKIRNLEKRKAKLDGYRLIVKEGGSLDKDKKAAVGKYDEVVGALSMLKELCKMFNTITVDAQKAAKKNKHLQMQKQQEQEKKSLQKALAISEMFKLVALNDKVQMQLSTSEEEDREAVLTGDELSMIVQFHNDHLSSISYTEGSNLVQESDAIAEKLYWLSQSSNKSLSDSVSYSNLHNIYQKLVDSNYFTQLPYVTMTVKDNDTVPSEHEEEQVNGIDEEASLDENYSTEVNPSEFERTIENLELVNPEPEPIVDNEIDEIDDDSVVDGDIKTTEFVASENRNPVTFGEVSTTELQFFANNNEEEEVAAEEPEPAAVEVKEEIPEMNDLSIIDILKRIDSENFGHKGSIDFTMTDLPSQEEKAEEPEPEEAPVYNGEKTASPPPPPPAVVNNQSPAPLEAALPPTMRLEPVLPNIYATSPSAKSLNMGETTFGNHNNYNPVVSQPAAPLPESNFQTITYQNYQEVPKPIETAPLNVHLQMQPPAMLPSMSYPDPPKEHIPLPNEELNYKTINSTLADNSSQPKKLAVNDLFTQRQPATLVTNDAPLLPNEPALYSPIKKVISDSDYSAKPSETNDHSQVSIKDQSDASNHVNSKQVPEGAEMLSQVEANEGKGDHISENDSGARVVNRNSGYNNGAAPYTKQPANNYRQNAAPVHNYYQNRQANNGGYRTNQRMYYDNGNNRSGYQQNVYQQPYRQDNNGGMYNNGMSRRGGPNPRGRSNNPRGGRPYNRSRTFRPQSEQTY